LNDQQNKTEAACGGSDLTAELDDDPMACVAMMLRLAIYNGLAVEVVTAFGQYRANGDSTKDAAHAALYDWDI